MVEPVLLYGSEIWGYENIKIIEQVHLQFCKRILKVRTTTPNFMVYGELGKFPLEIKAKTKNSNRNGTMEKYPKRKSFMSFM